MTHISSSPGFTLVELSIVLVIVGLIIGGVVTGKDLIAAATVRAQISQVEKYQTAANTFKGKYGFLPGDISDPTASSFGFAARNPVPGGGDGNGVIEAQQPCGGGNVGEGENAMFWRDLSDAKLIDGGFSTATPVYADDFISHTTDIGNYFPKARIGHQSYVFVWSNGTQSFVWPCSNPSGINYFGVASIGQMINGLVYAPNASAGMTVAEAYAIDKKVDDGQPQYGRVTAATPTTSTYWAAGGGGAGAVTYVFIGGLPAGTQPTTSATPASATTCYDNNNGNGNQNYSLGQNSGGGLNCALSFQFQ